jgi:hypothetical protein
MGCSPWRSSWGVGLLRRRNWARLAFIGVLVAGTLNGWVGVALQRSWLAALASGLPADPGYAEFREELLAMIPGLQAAVIATVLVATAFNALIIARLTSRAVRSEFEAQAR